MFFVKKNMYKNNHNLANDVVSVSMAWREFFVSQLQS